MNVHDQNKNPFSCNTEIIPVPVIASFNPDGMIKPLYFSIDGIRFKIDNIKSIDTTRIDLIVFICEITFPTHVEQIILQYYRRTQIWVLKK